MRYVCSFWICSNNFNGRKAASYLYFIQLYCHNANDTIIHCKILFDILQWTWSRCCFQMCVLECFYFIFEFEYNCPRMPNVVCTYGMGGCKGCDAEWMCSTVFFLFVFFVLATEALSRHYFREHQTQTSYAAYLFGLLWLKNFPKNVEGSKWMHRVAEWISNQKFEPQLAIEISISIPCTLYSLSSSSSSSFIFRPNICCMYASVNVSLSRFNSFYNNSLSTRKR